MTHHGWLGISLLDMRVTRVRFGSELSMIIYLRQMNVSFVLCAGCHQLLAA